MRWIGIDMSPALISGVEGRIPPRLLLEQFHLIKQVSEPIEEPRRLEQMLASDLKGLQWLLLKSRDWPPPQRNASSSIVCSLHDHDPHCASLAVPKSLREIRELDHFRNKITVETRNPDVRSTH